ncbi:Proline-rich antigen [Mycobacterium pseudokansasii]|nr:RDD family protein [Mycobacterium pseudokansasii]VBA33173.1 Proline-rich antigen [Mycobacterium pseudokansasii]
MGYRQGITGSTVGKSVLKFTVLSERTGAPIGVGSSIARYFAHLLDAITFGIGYLLPLFTAKRQTIADMVMNTACVLDEPPQVLRSHTARPRLRMALGAAVLVIAAALTALACLNATSHWICTDGGRYRHCGNQVSVGSISYPAWKIFDPYVQAALVTPLWTTGILIVLRYYRATYALVPVAGIVAMMVFAQGRYDWGWQHNWFAFLACVAATTAVCVLIARGITRSVAARRS